jgi:hypothetical protein
MNLHWGALGQVAVVSVGVAVALIVVFTLGVVALSQRDTAREHGRNGSVALTAASICFAACAAAVLYGIYLIIPQFHQ